MNPKQYGLFDRLLAFGARRSASKLLMAVLHMLANAKNSKQHPELDEAEDSDDLLAGCDWPDDIDENGETPLDRLRKYFPDSQSEQAEQSIF